MILGLRFKKEWIMKFLMDLHTHTIASVHAYSTVTENAIEAKKKGLEILGCSDHGYGMPHTTQPSYWMNLKILPDFLEGVRLLKGVEANIYNHKGDIFEEDLLDKVQYVVASLHGNTYEYDTSDVKDFTSAMINAMDRHPQINILGHPDDQRYPLDYKRVVEAAVRNNVAIEVNAASLSPTGFRLKAEENMRTYLPLCKEMGCKIVVNSDAHMSCYVGDFERINKLLEELKFPEELVVNTSWKNLEELIGMDL